MTRNYHTLQFIIWSFLQISEFCWVVVHPVPDGLQAHTHTLWEVCITEHYQHEHDTLTTTEHNPEKSCITETTINMNMTLWQWQNTTLRCVHHTDNYQHEHDTLTAKKLNTTLRSLLTATKQNTTLRTLLTATKQNTTLRSLLTATKQNTTLRTLLTATKQNTNLRSLDHTETTINMNMTLWQQLNKTQLWEVWITQNTIIYQHDSNKTRPPQPTYLHFIILDLSLWASLPLPFCNSFPLSPPLSKVICWMFLVQMDNSPPPPPPPNVTVFRRWSILW